MITYTNDAKDVVDSLYNIISAEFSEINVVYADLFDLAYLTKSYYIRYFMLEDRQIERLADGETRGYQFEIVIYLKSDYLQERQNFGKYTDYAERLKRLLQNNHAYAPSDAYKWHDVDITNIEYSAEKEEQDIGGMENVRGVYVTLNITRSNFWG